MRATTKDCPCHSTLSFFEFTAWVSLFISVGSVLGVIVNLFFPLFKGEAFEDTDNFAAAGLFLGLILGVVSLIGFRWHRRKLTLWIAGTGVLISGGLIFGFIAFFPLIIGNCAV